MKRGVVIAVFLLVCAPLVFATQNCVTSDFKGAYGIRANGAVTVPGFPITGPFARAGQVRADGNGNVVFHTTASYNGLMFSEAIGGTYEVAADCTITFAIEPFAPIFQPATFNGVLSDNKRQVTFMISNPPGQTIHAELRRQDAGGCSVTSLSKSYALLFQGAIVTPAPGQLPGEFVRSGVVTFDGVGNFAADTIANYNGFLIQPENFTGTYTVAPNCTVAMQYSYAGNDQTWTGALIDNSKAVDLVVSSPAGAAVNGTLQQQ